MTQRTIWTLTDDKIGMINQALGLAEAVARIDGDWRIVEKKIAPAAPWKWLPPLLWPAGVDGVGPDGDALDPPWPDLVVSCGRTAVGPALAVKRESDRNTFIVNAQHPRISSERFDLFVAQSHDVLSGSNVMVIRGSLNRITAEKLAVAAEHFRPMLADLPRPLVAVLIGGDNKVYRLTPAVTRRLADDLARLAEAGGYGLAITPSRRTGADNETILRERLAGSAAVVWDGVGENPYLGFLGLADAIVVTCDSVNMVSEACSTGNPVHVVDLEGGGDSKFERFHRELRDAGVTKPFAGTIESWSYPAMDETERVAAEVRRRMGLA